MKKETKGDIHSMEKRKKGKDETLRSVVIRSWLWCLKMSLLTIVLYSLVVLILMNCIR
jgi:hypothetical protein